MSKITYTPGPWRINSGRDQDVFSNDGRPIAACNTQGGFGASKEDEANARLIAAAPDLLEALREIVETTGGYVPDTSKAIWRQAEAALTKATEE